MTNTAQSSTSTESNPPESDHNDEGPISVLVVDDHLLLAESVVRALLREGFEAQSVQPASPTVILQEAAVMDPRIVLVGLDFGNVRFSGLDLIGPLTDLGAAVVVLTGWRDRLLRAASLDLGAAGVVGKSESFAAVVRAVELAAAGRAVHGPLERDELRRELREHRTAYAVGLAPFDQLSLREAEVLSALVDGQSATAIAGRSFVSITTVRSQIRSVLQKLHVNSQLEAVAAARRCGWSADASLPMIRYSSTLKL